MKTSAKLLYTSTAVCIALVVKPQGDPKPWTVTKLQSCTHILTSFIIHNLHLPQHCFICDVNSISAAGKYTNMESISRD